MRSLSIKNSCALILIISVLFSNNVFIKADTSGADFLKFPVNAKSIALGGTFSIYENDINVIHSNPAGISSLKNKQISFTHFQLVEGKMNFDYLGYGHPYFNNYFGIGAIFFYTSFTHFGTSGEMEENTTIYDLCFSMSYGRRIFRFEMGINLKYIHRNLVGNKANAFATDLGVIRRFKFLNLFIKQDMDNCSFGIAVRNLGTKVKFQNVGDNLPLAFSTGIGYNLVRDLLLLFDLDKYYLEEGSIFQYVVEY